MTKPVWLNDGQIKSKINDSSGIIILSTSIVGVVVKFVFYNVQVDQLGK